jgi:ferredoxin
VKVRVDLGRCQGHNRCLAVAPELFDVDDEGYALVLNDGQVPDQATEQAELAMDNCPEQAIELDDRQGEGSGR